MFRVQMQRSRRKSLTCFENASCLLPEMRVIPLPAGWAAGTKMSEGTSFYPGSADSAEEDNAKAVLFPAGKSPFPLVVHSEFSVVAKLLLQKPFRSLEFLYGDSTRM